MEILNYGGFIGKIYFRSIRIYPFFKLKYYFPIYRNKFLGERWNLLGFLKLHPKFTDRINSGDYIGKIT